MQYIGGLIVFIVIANIHDWIKGITFYDRKVTEYVINIIITCVICAFIKIVKEKYFGD